jgi:DNA-directed RNA polymerase specialized sigma24 family protein
VSLRVIAGLDTRSTARILGKTQVAVRSRLHRGLGTLSADPRAQTMAKAPRNSA